MALQLACADFTFPLLSHDQSLQLIKLLGAEGWAITLHDEGMSAEQLAEVRDQLEARFEIPVLRPLVDNLRSLARFIRNKLEEAS